MKLNLSIILYAIPVFFFTWLAWSWVDVLAHQDIIGGTQNALNFFVIITSIG